MRISFSRSGGFATFPGLDAPVTLDTSVLDPAERGAFEQLVQDARFAELPPHVGRVPAGAADYRTYEITVEDQGRAHTVRAVEPIANSALQNLVDRLEQHRRSGRSS